jgi:hypothetical protein
MNTVDFNLSMALMAIGAGVVIASAIWMLITRWIRNSAVERTRKMYESRMPFSMEEVAAERELTKAEHLHEIRLLQLQISELEIREAQAKVKAAQSLNRISKLNDRIEMLRLELAAKRGAPQLPELDKPAEPAIVN